MNNRSELNSYIARLQHRLRLGAWLRGAAIFTGTALAITVVLVILLNRLAFPTLGVSAARLAIFVALGLAAAFGIALPVIRLTRDRAVREAESANPGLEERLTTFQDQTKKSNDPFLELLAADTLKHTSETGPQLLVPQNRLFALGGAGFACFAVLAWLIADGPGYLGYGASMLWTNRTATPLYAIAVTPGDLTVRRNSDQLVTAQVTGMHPAKARLFAHYQSTSGWEPVSMQEEHDTGGGATYQFVFAGLPEDVEYYVAAGPLVSSHYKLHVLDLPSVKEIKVTYHYPAWTGMRPTTDERTGDLRAIEGTEATIDVQMDRPLKNGEFVLDSGQTINLTAGVDNRYQGSIHLEKDGAYHVADTNDGQQVRLSEDYFIATDKAMPPEVAISRPAGDYRASPIEEVTVGVTANDPFGLRDIQLHYSVNGGANRDVNLLQSPGTKSGGGTYTLPLEEFKLVPGDLVSVYATARDGHSEARTDISFIQVEPFEREFSQSQQSGDGGGGAGGNNQTEISRREKELIAATWKQQNDKTATPKEAAAAGQFLSEAQRKLRDQVMALSVRMQSRDLSAANEEFTDFAKDMQDAAAAMLPSADKLERMQWKDAMQSEQKALQALLRAEATFRKIEVAFGQRGGSGAAGGGAGRDLASLFDLELDTEKNQYETAQKASPAEQHQKDVDDALQKLDALAKRQEDLANQQRNPPQSFQERWQQEMLRREAEQLQRQIEQMAKGGQPGAYGSQANSQQQSATGQASGGTSSKSADPRIAQALQRLRQATDAMKRADASQQGANTAGQQAAGQLRQASSLLGGTQQQLASGKLDSLAREGGRLAQEEHSQAEQISKFANQHRESDATDVDDVTARLRERNRLAQERQQLSDDLSKLQKNIRDTAREMASSQPQAAQKLRDALGEIDESDLDNHVQRTADWLRRGIDPNSNGTEGEIAQGLQKLNQQLQEAQQGVGQGKPGKGDSGQPETTAAIDQVEKLRSQLKAMTASRGNNKSAGQNSPQLQGGEQWRAGQASSGAIQREDNPADPSGDVRYGGGAPTDGTVWGNINTGNNRYGGNVPTPAGPNYGTDPERTFQQGMRELNELRHMVQNDPQAAKEIQELARQMQQLDPSRFPGNPRMVERMQRELLGSIDKLELLLRRNDASSTARTGKADAVPAEYQESVADYYRRLSKNP